MMRIIFQAIKLAPRLLWQMYTQPSRLYDFVKKSKDNVYLCTWGFFFAGFFIGIIASFPHYYISGDIYQSLLFALTFAVIVTFSFAHAFAFAGASPAAFSISLLFAVLLAFTGAAPVIFTRAVTALFAFAFAVLFAFGGAFVGAFAVTGVLAFSNALVVARILTDTAPGSVEKTTINAFFIKIANLPGTIVILVVIFILLCLFFYLVFKSKIKIPYKFAPLIFTAAVTFILFKIWASLPVGKVVFLVYQLFLFHFSFLMGYTITGYFLFVETSSTHDKIEGHKKRKTLNIERQNFGRIQKSSLIWCPLVTILLYIYASISEKIKINTEFHIIAWGFIVILLFISHVPDYLLYLPIWRRQRRKIMQENRNARESIREYENAFLFKHELLLFPLSGLYKIPVFFAGNRNIGMREAVKHIIHLYQFTFQQKQARKAAVKLLEDKASTHGLVLSFLEFEGDDLIENFARDHPLAALYHRLMEKIEPGEPVKVKDNLKNKKEPQSQDFLVHDVSREMAEQEGYGFNEEMVATLEAIHILLIADSINDIGTAVGQLEEIKTFPGDITYFSLIRDLVTGLKKIKNSLDKIKDVERLVDKRSILNDQKQQCEALIQKVEQTFFQPFKSLWGSGLKQCIEVISREITLLKGSALVTFRLKNSEITASPAGQRLYFEIGNKGQELAEDISVTLETGTPWVSFTAETGVKINVIETHSVKEISIPIIAPDEGKTTVKGVLTFSDRARSGKTLDFSFPLIILKKGGEFKKIANPYVVGTPLMGDAPFFFGRDEAYRFIDQNILPAGGSHHTLLCHGRRRTGKTSLLYRLEYRGFTDKRLIPVNIDMQGIDDEKDFYKTLRDAVCEKLDLTAAGTGDNFSGFKGFLKEIKKELGERIMVLMVDEFEELQMRVEDGKISRTVFSNIRHLMQHEEKLVFLFCGTHRLEELSKDYWSIFFNTAVYLRLGSLKPEHAVQLIKVPVKDQLTYDDLAVEQILKMSGCQPYLIQLICWHVVNNLNENKKRNHALVSDVDEVVERIIDKGTEYFSKHTWDESAPLQRLVLSCAAGELTYRQLEYIGVDDIFEKIKPLRPELTKKELIGPLDQLVSKEVLAEREMRYWFPVNLFRKWVAARYPLKRLREEL
jgi:hypothetical protein